MAYFSSYLSYGYNKIPGKSDLRESLFWLTVQGYRLSWWGSWQHESEAAVHIHHQEAENYELCCSALLFLLFIQARIPVHGIVLPSAKVDIHTSINLN